MNVYSGIETYAFVSYAHKDAAAVMPILGILSNLGARLWFDEGLHPANDYTEEIAQRIENASFVIAMISENYVNSRYCRDEIQFAHSCNKEILSIQLEDCTLSAGLKMILNRYQYYNIQNKKDDDIYNDMRGIIPEKVIEPKGKLLGYIGRCAYYLRFRNSDPGYEIYEFSFDTNTETDLLKRPLGKYCDAHFSYSVKGSYFSGYRTEEKVVLEMIEEIDPIPYSPFLATVRYEIKRKSGKSILQKQTVSLEYRDKITLCNYVKGVNTTVSNDNTVTIRGTDIKGNKWDV